MRGSPRTAATALALSLAAASASADTWSPCPDRRVSSPTGRHYLVLRGESAARPAGDFELVRRKYGAAALADAEAWRDDKVPQPSVEADPADTVLAKGRLRHLPGAVLVLDGEPAAVLVDRWGGNRDGPVLGLLDRDGRFRWNLSIRDLFPAETLREFPRSTFSIHWCRASW